MVNNNQGLIQECYRNYIEYGNKLKVRQPASYLILAILLRSSSITRAERMELIRKRLIPSEVLKKDGSEWVAGPRLKGLIGFLPDAQVQIDKQLYLQKYLEYDLCGYDAGVRFTVGQVGVLLACMSGSKSTEDVARDMNRTTNSISSQVKALVSHGFMEPRPKLLAGKLSVTPAGEEYISLLTSGLGCRQASCLDG